MMSSDDDEQIISTPPEMLEKAKMAQNELLPAKSRERYEIAYQKFMDWRLRNNTVSFSENILLVYFQELSNSLKPSSLWSIYSMLRSTLNINHNINIATYPKLISFLKRKSDGFRSKKSKILNAEQINYFLQNAPDDEYLFMKVVLILGISGACRKQELRNINPEHVEDTGKSLIITIPDSKTKIQRSFVVSESFYPTCKKYMNLRPLGENIKLLPFFLNYKNKKCTKQCVGINKFGSVPKNIAKYLGLSDANQYTGHCFRRSSATILVDAGGDLLALKRHGGWRSSAVAESYVDQSLQTKTDTASKITCAINNESNKSSSSNVDIVRDNNITLENNIVSNNTYATTTHYTNTGKEVSNPSFTFNNCTVTINNHYKC